MSIIDDLAQAWYDIGGTDLAESIGNTIGDAVDSVASAIGFDSSEEKNTPLQDDPNDLSDEEIEDSIIAQNLNTWVEIRKEKEKENSYYNNIILLNCKIPSKLKNNVLSFDPNNVNGLFSATNLQLSNLVPVIEIYKIYKSTNSDNNLEVLLPFPDYTQKQDLDDIFLTRTGRGGGIGIKSFQWNSIAKNQANLAQFNAKLKIYLQDASELTKVRNYKDMGNRVYTVSVLDLLYPTVKEGSPSSESFEYDPKSFFLKIKIGWKFGDKLENPDTKLDDKLISNLSSEYYLTLYKHNIQFGDDGSLEIEADFMAMAEAMLDNTNTSDILFQDFFDPTQDSRISEINKKTRELNDKKLTASLDIAKEQINKQLEALKQEASTLEIKEKKAKRIIYKNFLIWLNSNDRVEYIQIKEQDKIRLRSIFTFNEKVLDTETLPEFLKRLKDSQEELAKPGPTLSHLQTTIDNPPEEENVSDYKPEEVSDAIVDEYRQAIKKRMENAETGDLFVPYFYLGDLFEYFFGKFTEKRYSSNVEVLTSNIQNKKLRLVMGSFSYSDYGNPQISFQEGGVLSRTTTIKTGSKAGRKQKVALLSGEKKIANLAHIPISMKSFLRWFNTKIIDSNLEKYTINRFVRDVIYSLVPANINNKISRATPNLKISLTMNTDSIDDLAKIYDNKSIADFLQDIYPINNNYIVDFDSGNSPFLHLKSKKSNFELIRSENEQNTKMIDYLFLFSNFEYENTLNRDFDLDKKNNIFHFFIGEEKGFIKSIKFNREDNPKFNAYAIQEANKGNQGAIIRNVYHADIEMFGNTIFSPGMILFLSPTYPGIKLGDNTLLQIGLGGYFTVLEVNSRIEGGLYTTYLKTKWQSFGVDPSSISTKDFGETEYNNLLRQGFSEVSFI